LTFPAISRKRIAEKRQTAVVMRAYTGDMRMRVAYACEREQAGKLGLHEGLKINVNIKPLQ
jgi:hypothetical protein